MASYARELPRDRLNEQIQDASPAFVGQARYLASTQTSSVITLTDSTTILEIGAIGGGGILVKWIATSDTTASVTGSNFDGFIPPSWTKKFVVPIEKAGTQSVVGINKQLGLYNRLAWVAAAGPASSVAAVEF